MMSRYTSLLNRCTRFQRETQLQELVGQLVKEIQSGCGLKEVESVTKAELKDVFDLLPAASQKTILIGTAGLIIL